ncbi:hypothetical protein SPLC1_S031860 [Arthrospira platensis C1]|nr:hypothetical protein SPLC1_S031860 [Arthrospira platensis C1]
MIQIHQGESFRHGDIAKGSGFLGFDEHDPIEYT